VSVRLAVSFAAAAVLGVLVAGAYFGQPSAAQDLPPLRPPGPAAVGRYQMMPLPEDKSVAFIVMDTATGQCWKNYLGAGGERVWQDLGSPTAPRKR